ncbi:hypothetical protein KAR48_18000, partial [bacterium]|nr:hypothetical protein [bacterium]
MAGRLWSKFSMFCLVLSLCLATTACGHAQNIFNQTAQIRFEHMTIHDGLPTNFVRVNHQDHLGYLWLTSLKGLVRYDGYDLIHYPYLDSTAAASTMQITRLNEDTEGNLWFVADPYGIYKYDRQLDRVEIIDHPLLKAYNPHQSCFLTSFLDSHGKLWIWGYHPKDTHLHALDYYDTKKHEFVVSPLTLKDSTFTIDDYSINTIAGLYMPTIAEDSLSNLWIGTFSHGLFHYQQETGTIVNYRNEPGKENSLSSDHINNLKYTRDGILWVCTNNGLFRHDISTDIFERIGNSVLPEYGLVSDTCSSVYMDNRNHIWVSMPYALDCLNLETGQVTHYSHDPTNPQSLRLALDCWPVYEPQENLLWILVHEGYGSLDVLNIVTGKVAHYTDDSEDEYAIRAKHLASFFVDHSENVWIGTFVQGLNKCNPNIQVFQTLDKHNSGLSHNDVRAICESHGDVKSVYTATAAGIDIYCPGEGYYNLHDRYSVNGEKKRDISCLTVDNEGHLWFGTNFAGLYQYDGACIKSCMKHEMGNPLTLTSERITFCELVDDHGFWIGTNYGGLNLINSNTMCVERVFTKLLDTLQFNADYLLRCALQDPDDRIWLGSNGGLCRYNPVDSSFTRVIIYADVQCIFFNSGGTIWLGTSAKGLGRLDPETHELKYYSTPQGLVHPNVHSIAEDDHGTLWIATATGLSRFDPYLESFTNYTEKQGLPTSELKHFAKRLSDGNIYLGTSGKGIIYFNPDDLSANPHPPKVVVSELKLANVPIRPGSDSVLKQDISLTKRIELAHWQNDLTFVSSALHYSQPEENTYRYYLENDDEDWYDAGHRREMTYNNLNPGRYVFHVQAASCDGVWNREGVAIEILIRHPWYGTLWAYMGYGVLALGLLILIWRNQVRRIHLQHAFQMKQSEAERLNEIDEMKSRFLTNISHEFRTPLTLILGLADFWLKSAKDERLISDLRSMKKNGKRLLKLVNQLLDLSKIDAGTLKLNPTPTEIISFITRIVQTFESQANLKQIDLSLQTTLLSLTMAVDQDKLENILYNLLSNALKFTAEGGAVNVRVEQLGDEPGSHSEQLVITVVDTGVGFHPNEAEHLFERFYQSPEHKKHHAEGTGIGLALTCEFVKLHQGKIEAEGEQGKGATFIVTLPVAKDSEQHVLQSSMPEAIGTDKSEINVEAESKRAELDEASRILIIEDNDDLRDYLKRILGDVYQIEEAKQGKAGLKSAMKSIPELIISDVMMP